MIPTAEQLLLADAILRHRPYSREVALRRALWATGEIVDDDALLHEYAYSITIDMVPDGYRLVSRDGVPLLGLGALELFEQDGIPRLLTKCAVWYGTEALEEWQRRGGK